MKRTVGAVEVAVGVTRRVPWVRLQSRESGPNVVITANVHGDEVTGVLATQALDSWLQDHLQCGTVTLYPSLNPSGLAAGMRGVPSGGTDLNRLFPGGRRRAEERLAAAIWGDIEERRPDVVIDLHADSLAAIPYAIVDRPVRLTGDERKAMAARLTRIAAATGLTVLREYPDDQYLRYALDRSLAGAVVNRLRVPAVTIEVGPRRYADPTAVSTMLRAVLGVFAELGLVSGALPSESRRYEGVWRRAAAPRVSASGLFVPLVAPGTRFERGQVLGLLRRVDGEVIERIKAPEGGLVVAWAERTWVETGGVVGTLGVPDGDEL